MLMQVCFYDTNQQYIIMISDSGALNSWDVRYVGPKTVRVPSLWLEATQRAQLVTKFCECGVLAA